MDLEKKLGDASRRDFLKRSLVVGAAVWSAPSVVSLPGGRAWAQTYGVCNCNAEAFGLFVDITPLSITQTFGEDGCLDKVNVGNNTTARVRANTVCGTDFSSVNAGCSSEATIEMLNVRVGPLAAPTLLVAASVLFTSASAVCNPCDTKGDFSAASVTVSGSAVGGVISVPVSTSCNLDVAGLGLVIVNERTCSGDTLTVNAVHVIVPGIIEVIAAHSSAGATNCPCTTTC